MSPLRNSRWGGDVTYPCGFSINAWVHTGANIGASTHTCIYSTISKLTKCINLFMNFMPYCKFQLANRRKWSDASASASASALLAVGNGVCVATNLPLHICDTFHLFYTPAHGPHTQRRRRLTTAKMRIDDSYAIPTTTMSHSRVI